MRVFVAVIADGVDRLGGSAYEVPSVIEESVDEFGLYIFAEVFSCPSRVAQIAEKMASLHKAMLEVQGKHVPHVANHSANGLVGPIIVLNRNLSAAELFRVMP